MCDPGVSSFSTERVHKPVAETGLMKCCIQGQRSIAWRLRLLKTLVSLRSLQMTGWPLTVTSETNDDVILLVTEQWRRGDWLTGIKQRNTTNLLHDAAHTQQKDLLHTHTCKHAASWEKSLTAGSRSLSAFNTTLLFLFSHQRSNTELAARRSATEKSHNWSTFGLKACFPFTNELKQNKKHWCNFSAIDITNM